MQYRAYFETEANSLGNTHTIEAETISELIKKTLSLLSDLGISAQVLNNLVIWPPENSGSIVVNLQPDGSIVSSLLGNPVAI